MASRFWVGGTGTWDASDTTHWAATSGGAGGQSVPTSADDVLFDASSGGGTVTVNHATLTVNSLTMGAFGGTLDFATNNNNITITTGFVGSGTGTRTLNMGNGTWTIQSTAGAVWDMTTTTNLTFNRNSSTLLFSCTPTGGRTFAFGGLTYNNVHINNAAVRGFEHQFTSAGAFTIAGTLTFTNVGLCRMAQSTTITITGTWTWSGSASAMGVMYTNGAAGTISVGATNVLDYVCMGAITKSGAGSITINNGYNLGNLTNITVNNPSGGASGPRVIGG